MSSKHMLFHHFIDNSLVFLSDRQKGLIKGVQALFPNSPHAYCLRHLEDNMFKHPELKKLLWKAARATTEAEFNQHLQAMKTINPQCHDWLLSTADPAHWADLYFKGKRYGHLTSNIAEAFNSKILIARRCQFLLCLRRFVIN